MDLNMMMREQARTGLQAQLDAAVTEGDTAKARKLADDIAKLDVSTAPKPEVSYGNDEIKAALEKKAEWFGVDPRKSGAAVRLGKDMNPKKFASADAFADALIKAVEEEFKPAGTPAPKAGEENEEGEEGEDAETNEEGEDPPAKPAKRKTDAPGDLTAGSGTRPRKGPWTKLADAPADVQKDIRRQADKFVPASATKEQRESFTAKALESAYRASQLRKGK